MRKPSSAVWVITAASLAYATLRYNVFKGVAWADWPVFILNKGLALASLLLLAAWILGHRRSTDASEPALLAAASRLMLAHIGLSLAALSPVYFPAFFADGRLTWQAGTALAIGVAAAVALPVVSRPGRAHRPGFAASASSRCGLPCGVVRVSSWFTPAAHRSRLRGLGLIAFAAGCHAALFGYSSWFTPAAWPGSCRPSRSSRLRQASSVPSPPSTNACQSKTARS